MKTRPKTSSVWNHEEKSSPTTKKKNAVSGTIMVDEPSLPAKMILALKKRLRWAMGDK